MKLGNYYFKFDHRKDRLNSIGKLERSSTLSVYSADQGKGEEPFWREVIIRFHKDPYNKETARKILLGKFLKEIVPENEKKLIWEAYRNSKPGGRW